MRDLLMNLSSRNLFILFSLLLTPFSFHKESSHLERKEKSELSNVNLLGLESLSIYDLSDECDESEEEEFSSFRRLNQTSEKDLETGKSFTKHKLKQKKDIARHFWARGSKSDYDDLNFIGPVLMDPNVFDDLSNHTCSGECFSEPVERSTKQILDDAWYYFTYKVGEAFDNLKFWEEEEVKPLTAMMMDETLPAGTWIIAMDDTNQDGSDDRVRQAYGLAVHLLHAGVPLKWIIDPNKDNRTDVDFSANVTRVYPSAETAQNRNFITGPLAIFPGFETQAASVISSFEYGIRVYELVNDEFNVPIHSNLTHKPRVLVESNNENIHSDILNAAGLSSGTHYEVGTIVGLNDSSCYTLITVPHNEQINDATRIGARNFVQNGGNIYAQCAAIRSFQNTAPRLFIDSGFIEEGMGTFQYDNPSEPAAQFEGTIADKGGSVKSFGFNTPPVGGNRIVHDADNVYKFYVAPIDNQITSTGGYIHYMGGHNHNGDIDADRTYLNALLRPAERPMECGLNLGPIAIDDSGNIDCNSDSVTIDVLANDSDPLNNGLTVNIVSSGIYGTTVNNNDGTVTYTANLSVLWQEDEIIYEACSGGSCSQAIITINSSDPNQSNIAGTVYEDVNENGTFDNGDTGQSDVTINLYEDNGSGSFDAGDNFIESVSTNASGDYSFSISSFPNQSGSATITSQKVTSAYNGQTFVGYGSCNEAYIENSPSYSYLEFDLASIPPGSTITSASLEITTSGGSGSGLNFEVRKVLESWVEGDGTCWPDGNDSGLTWTNRPNLGANSYASGIINDAQSSGVLYNLDITNLVSEWVNGVSNYGLAIVNSGGSGEYSFYSDDAAQVNRPKLNIDYTIPSVMDYWVVLEESTLPNGSNLTTSSNSFIQFTNLGQLDCNNDFGFDISCANQPSLSLSSNTGSTCGVESVTVSSNTYGGSATQVTISHDGNGLLTPLVAASSPFEFTYTPVASDAGNIVTLTVTTNNPLGPPCVPAVATYVLTVDANPEVPVVNVDCSGGNINADVFVSSPLGAQYQYQLNNGAFQSSPAFLSVAPDTYTVTVVNINTGCEATTAPFEVLCECPDDPTLNLSENSGSICAGGSVTISGSTFGGSATNVSLSHDGNGSLVPIFSATSPFEFTYNSVLSEGGNTVTITVTTNNPIGGLCEPATDQYLLTVFPKPIIGGINLQDPTQCGLCDGTITLVGVDPPSGPYLVTYTKDGIPQTGSYVAIAGTITLTGQCEGSYDDFVISQNGCISDPEIGPFILSEPELPNGAITGPARACLNESTGLYSVAGLANCNSCQYLWSSTGGLADNPNGSLTNFTFASSGIQTIVLEFTDQLTNCSNTFEYQVNVYGTPVIIGVSQSTCIGTTRNVTVNASVTPPEALEYSLDGGPYQLSNAFFGVPDGQHQVDARIVGTTCTSALPFTFDVDCTCLTPASASIGGPNVICSSETATFIGNFVNVTGGTWSIFSGGGSLSTPSCTSNGCETIFTPAGPGNVIIRLTSDDPDGLGPCIPDITDFNLLVNQTPTINTGEKTDPSMCDSCDGLVRLLGVSPNGTYNVTYTKEGAVQSATVNAVGGILEIDGLCEGSYADFVITINSCSSAPFAGPITLIDPLVPIGLIAGPNTACLNEQTGIYTVAGLQNCTDCDYAWSSTGGIPTNPTGLQTDFVFSASGLQSVELRITSGVTGCRTILNYNVDVYGMPEVNSVSQSSCLSDQATVTVNASVDPPAALEYSLDGGLYQSSNIFTNVTEGSHEVIVRIAGTNCTSQNPFLFEVECLCINQPSSSITGSLLTCADSPVILTGNLFNASSGTWSIQSGGGTLSTNNCLSNGCSVTYSPNSNLTSNETVDIVLTTEDPDGLGPCLPNTYLHQIEVLAVPKIASLTKFDPTECDLCDGAFTISGLNPGELYQVLYNAPGGPQIGSLVANPNGQITIGGLCEGTYNNIVVSKNGCDAVPAGSLTLVEPSDPPAPLVSNNGPLCTGDLLQLQAIGESAATYFWTGPDGFISNQQNPQLDNVGLINAGQYCAYQVVAGCPSPIACTTVEINLTPDISNVAFTNPTTCEGSDGTITLSGLSPNSLFTVNYISSIVGFVETSLLSTVLGQLTVNNLSEGIYSDITVTSIFGCTSKTVGPVILVDPENPAAPSVSSNSPVCEPDDLILMASGEAGAIFNWTGPNGFIANGPSIIRSNTDPSMSGTYSVTQTVDNCVSTPAITNAVVLTSPVPNMNISAERVCVNSLITLDTDFDPQTNNILWYKEGSNIPIATGFGPISVQSEWGIGFYHVLVSNLNGCITRDTVYFEPLICAELDINQTLVNVPAGGDVSKNDEAPVGSMFMIVDTDPNGSIVMNADGTYIYTPNTNFIGTSFYTYKVCGPDDFTICETTTLTIEVRPEAMVPNSVIAHDDHNKTPLNTPVTSCILCNDGDPQGDNIGIPVQLPGGDIPVGSNVSFNGDGTVKYTPPSDFEGVVKIPYEIFDSGSPVARDQANLIIDIVPLDIDNNTTNANDDAYIGYLDEKLNGDVSLNDNDQQGDNQTFALVPGTVENGAVMLNPDGTFMFTPDPGYIGPATFNYEVCDDGTPVACDVATVYITFHKRFGAIDGKVWEDSNGNGIQNASESFEECVLVELYESNGTYIKSVLTDENGYYLIDEISPGNYLVKFADFCSGIDPEWTIKDQGFNDYVDSDVFVSGLSDLIDVLPGDTTEVDAGFFECITIGELVWYDTNENDLWDWNENGINGLKVSVFRKIEFSSHFELLDYTYTSHKPNTPSDDGWWKMCVRPGEYYVQFGTPLNGLVPAQPNVGPFEEIDSDIDDWNGPYSTEIFVVESGEEKCDIGAGFYQMATAGDMIWRDENSNGKRDNFEERLEGVVVEVYDNEGDKVAETSSDSEGIYTIENLQQEDYYFKVIPPAGMHPTEANVGDDDLDSDIDGSNGPNTTAFYTMESGNHSGNIDIGLKVAGVVPIELIAFWGANRGEFNYLEWSTASEIANSHFEIERRLNDGSFSKIGNVEGNGTTNDEHSYNFEDWDISESGIYYYRLRQVDVNNNFEYSGIVAIKIIEKGDVGKVNVYPNPIIDVFNIEVIANIEESKVELSIYDMSGKLIRTELLNESQTLGKGSYQVNINDLPEGTYNVKVVMNENEFMKKLIKIRD